MYGIRLVIGEYHLSYYLDQIILEQPAFQTIEDNNHLLRLPVKWRNIWLDSLLI